MRKILSLGWMLLGSPLFGAEHLFDFGGATLGSPPPGCISTVVGGGKPGNWKVILDEVAPEQAPLSASAPKTVKKTVVAQVAETDMTDEHFPMLLLGDEVYGDFTFTVRFKMVSGIFERMAGMAFRVQNEKNYYALRASSIGRNVAFYKVENGKRGEMLYLTADIPLNEWHELTVQCKAQSINFLFDGKEPFPSVTDLSFSAGKVGVWTKSDAVSYFSDMKINFVPRERFAQTVVRETIKEKPRLLGLRIAAMMPNSTDTAQVIASNDEKEIGQPGEKADADVIKRGVIIYHAENEEFFVTMPLRDRNGELSGAVRLVLKRFRGQSDDNAIARATPIVKAMQARLATAGSLTE